MLAELNNSRNRDNPIDLEEEETGLPLLDEKEKDAKQSLSNVVAEGALYSDLREHPGWKKLASFIEAQVKSLKTQLVVERKYNKMMRIQEQIQTLEFLPNLVDSFVTDAEAAKEMLQSRFSDRELPR